MMLTIFSCASSPLVYLLYTTQASFLIGLFVHTLFLYKICICLDLPTITLRIALNPLQHSYPFWDHVSYAENISMLASLLWWLAGNKFSRFCLSWNTSIPHCTVRLFPRDVKLEVAIVFFLCFKNITPLSLSFTTSLEKSAVYLAAHLKTSTSSLPLVFISFDNELPWIVFFVLCLGFIDILGPISWCCSSVLKSSWPVPLKTLLLLQYMSLFILRIQSHIFDLFTMYHMPLTQFSAFSTCFSLYASVWILSPRSLILFSTVSNLWLNP